MNILDVRAWFTKTQTTRYVSLSNIHLLRTGYFYLSPRLGSDYEPIEVMRQTGIIYDATERDINRPMYEGDIVHYMSDPTDVVRVIEYKEEEACFVARLPEGDNTSEECVYLNAHDFKYLGHKFEQHQLLKNRGTD